MLNEWSDREPDTPRHSSFPMVLGVIVAIAVIAFLAQIALSILGD